MPHLNSSLFLIPSLFPGIVLSCLTGSSSPGLSNKVKSTNNGSFGQLAGFYFLVRKKSRLHPRVAVWLPLCVIICDPQKDVLPMRNKAYFTIQENRVLLQVLQKERNL